jgi:outer membrane protein TolC
MKTVFSPALPGLLLLSLAAGCASFEPVKARHDQTASFTNSLAVLAGVELTRPLSLDDCIRLAMTNSYDVRQADLRRELSRIGKNVAFTAFLPNVAATTGYKSYSKSPENSERQVSSGSLDASMPIFMPSTWFLYAATRHGYASAEIASFYVRQSIVLQTSTAYYDVLVQQDTVAALENQLAAARENAVRVSGLAREGLVADWEGGQARFMAENREAELNRARRRLTVARGELLTGLGLSPAAPIRLSGQTGESRTPPGSTEELVLRALEVHPALSMADRQVVIREHQVRQAFCNFLPTLSLFSSRTWTGNDLAKNSANWVTGLAGTWTLFDGLANVARYNAAKVERRQSELERESTFLSIMIQVIASEAAARDAADIARIRKSAFEVASAKYADYDAKSREGLIPLSDALDARAVMDLAQVAVVQSQYQEKIAVAGLELAMGITLVPAAQADSKPGNPL